MFIVKFRISHRNLVKLSVSISAVHLIRDQNNWTDAIRASSMCPAGTCQLSEPQSREEVTMPWNTMLPSETTNRGALSIERKVLAAFVPCRHGCHLMIGRVCPRHKNGFQRP